MKETLKKVVMPEIPPATDKEIITYLHRSYQVAEIAAAAERDALILQICEQLEITISDAELQQAGDTFRLKHKLLRSSETLAWMAQQRISEENWSQGIRVSLLTQKLKEHLFGEAVDANYIINRNDYRRVALSQILVCNLTEAVKIVQMLREENASFCALALEYSKGKQSQQNGGFAGVRFLAELLPEIRQAISEAPAGRLIGPIETKLGYHILRIEKWFPADLSEVREQILESLFQAWQQVISTSPTRAELH